MYDGDIPPNILREMTRSRGLILLINPSFVPDEGRERYYMRFFDRTLASLAKKPVVIGVSYELAKIPTIHPQSWDVPMDWVVTERGVYRRDPEGLVFLGEPLAGEPSPLASPVCYAGELDPDRPDDPPR